MDERTRDLVAKAERVLTLLDAIEGDNGPAAGEWDAAKNELRAAIQAAVVSMSSAAA